MSEENVAAAEVTPVPAKGEGVATIQKDLSGDPLDELFLGTGEDPSDEEFAKAVGADIKTKPQKAPKEDKPEEITDEEEVQADDEDDPDDEEVDEDDLSEVSSSRLEAILDKLEKQAAAEMGMEAPKDAEPEPDGTPTPDAPRIAFPEFELSEDEHYEVMADHQNFNAYMRDFQAKTAQAVIQQMGPAMLNAAIQVQGAMQFEKELFSKYPELKDNPAIVNKALMSAQKKAPGAGFEKWMELTVEDLREVISVRRSLSRNKPVKDLRRNQSGQFAPRGTRPSRRAQRSSRDYDGTSQAFDDIANLGAQSGAALLTELGLD